MSIKLNKTTELGTKIENTGVESILTLPTTNEMYDKMNKLKTKEERSAFFKALKYEDFISEEGTIQIMNTIDRETKIFTTVNAEDYRDVFGADVNIRIKTLIDYNSYSGLTRKELTAMEVRV